MLRIGRAMRHTQPSLSNAVFIEAVVSVKVHLFTGSALPSVHYTPFYLNAAAGTLETQLPNGMHHVRYATGKSESPDRAGFIYRFSTET